MFIKRLPLTFLLVSSVSGCTSNAVQEHIETPIVQAIRVSAADIHGDLIQLTKLKELNPHNYTPRITPTEGPFTRKITLKWVGQAEEAVKTISMLTAIEMPKIIGHKPANPPSVIINAFDKPAFEVLEDIGMQMGSSSGISIGDNQITILYEGASE